MPLIAVLTLQVGYYAAQRVEDVDVATSMEEPLAAIAVGPPVSVAPPQLSTDRTGGAAFFVLDVGPLRTSQERAPPSSSLLPHGRSTAVSTDDQRCRLLDGEAVPMHGRPGAQPTPIDLSQGGGDDMARTITVILALICLAWLSAPGLAQQSMSDCDTWVAKINAEVGVRADEPATLPG